MDNCWLDHLHNFMMNSESPQPFLIWFCVLKEVNQQDLMCTALEENISLMSLSHTNDSIQIIVPKHAHKTACMGQLTLQCEKQLLIVALISHTHRIQAVVRLAIATQDLTIS